MADLATLDDLQARLGRLVTSEEQDRAAAILADASASVRTYTRQTISEETTTDRLRVRRGAVLLPQFPVSAVGAVTDINGNPLIVQWDGLQKLAVPSNLDSFAWVPWTSGITAVDVTYTHGWDPIPDVIVGVVCSIALRALGRQPLDSGIQQEAIAGYSYTLGAAGAAGGVGLLPDEKRVLDDFRRRGGWVQVGP